MAKYGRKTQEIIHRELHKHKHQGKWESREQAIAVGLSKAREKKLKAPPEKH